MQKIGRSDAMQLLQQQTGEQSGEVFDASVLTTMEDDVNLFGSEAGTSVIPLPTRPVSSPSPQKKISLAATQQMPSVPESPQQIIDWYRHVPIWFWTLFFSGLVAAIFFAGMLVILLMVYFGGT